MKPGGFIGYSCSSAGTDAREEAKEISTVERCITEGLCCGPYGQYFGTEVQNERKEERTWRGCV